MLYQLSYLAWSEKASGTRLRRMALRRLRWAAAGLAVVALASCGGGDGGETSTEAGQGGGENGVVGQVLDVLSDPGSAISAFEAFDWEGNVVRRVSRRSSAPHGQAIVETAESPGICPSRCLFLIRDRPALTGDDLAKAEQSLDPATNQPSVVLTLTAQGRRKFEQLTREVAQRGAKQQSPGAPSSERAQHVALMVGDRVLSLPIIDPKENPEGIDASSGVQITGAFTVAEAQALARALNPG